MENLVDMSKKGLESRKWDPELAKKNEGNLKELLEGIWSVSMVKGCSAEKSKDFKVVFTAQEDSHFLEFKPETKGTVGKLRGWASGLPYAYPKEVMDALTSYFPKANYWNEKGPGKDGFHEWIGISQAELGAKVEELKRAKELENSK